jgi:hypothetical protein
MKYETKTGECEGCTLKRKLSRFDIRFYGSEPGGTLRETWICTSCSKVIGLHELMTGDYTARLMLMVNSKLDMLLARKR